MSPNHNTPDLIISFVKNLSSGSALPLISEKEWESQKDVLSLFFSQANYLEKNKEWLAGKTLSPLVIESFGASRQTYQKDWLYLLSFLDQAGKSQLLSRHFWQCILNSPSSIDEKNLVYEIISQGVQTSGMKDFYTASCAPFLRNFPHSLQEMKKALVQNQEFIYDIKQKRGLDEYTEKIIAMMYESLDLPHSFTGSFCSPPLQEKSFFWLLPNIKKIVQREYLSSELMHQQVSKLPKM